MSLFNTLKKISKRYNEMVVCDCFVLIIFNLEMDRFVQAFDIGIKKKKTILNAVKIFVKTK
jgi:hypothetical protein